MAIQTVKTGAAVNDGTGDDARTAFTKINQNFTDSANAASRLVGTGAGNVMEVGAFGVGRFDKITSAISTPSQIPKGLSLAAMTTDLLGIASNVEWQNAAVLSLRAWDNSCLSGAQAQIAICGPENLLIRAGRSWDGSDVFDGGWVKIYTERNTTKDSNGFIKAASPIVQLFADKIELNSEAKLQDITFEKLGVGDYLVKGSLGFAQEGWYIEMPKDANGNVLVAVIYEQLDNNDISVKTYAKKFDEETGDVVANTAKPRDIPTARWIDLRLQALPQTNPQPLSKDETVNTNAE